MADDLDAPKIRFACTQCGKALSSRPAQAGKKVKCPSCAAVLMVPVPGGEAAAPLVEAQRQAGVGPSVVSPPPAALRPAPAVEERAVPPPVLSAAASRPAPDSADAPGADDAGGTGQAVVQAPSARPSGSALRRPGISRSRARAVDGRAGRSRYVEGPAGRPKKSKAGLWITVGVMAAAVLAFVGVGVSASMARAKTVRRLDGLVLKSKRALQDGELQEALKQTKAAKRLLGRSSGLDANKIGRWKKAFQAVADYKARLDEIGDLVRGARANPAQAKERLLTKKALLEADRKANAPFLQKIEDGLVQVAKAEREALLKGWRRTLAEADRLYAQGEIDAAVEKAKELHGELARHEKVQEPALSKRVARLRKLGESYDEAKRVRGRAKNNFDAALKELDAMLGKLKAAEADSRPLAAKLEAFKKSIQAEKKSYRRLSSKELQDLSRLARKLAQRDRGLQVGRSQPGSGVALTYAGQPLVLSLERGRKGKVPSLESNGQRFQGDAAFLQKRPGIFFRIVQQLGMAMRKAGVPAGAAWQVWHEAPFPAAQRPDADGLQFFFRDRLYRGEALAPPKNKAEAKKAVTQTAKALAEALKNDDQTEEDVRRVVGTLVRGAYQELGHYDYLPGDFCRKVLAEGYIQKNLPKTAQRLKAQLAAYQQAYENFSKLRPVFKGQNATGASFLCLVNYEGHRLYRAHDRKTGRTTFGIKVPDYEHSGLFSVYEFAGRQETFPEQAQPRKVYMTHPAVGVLSSYDPASGRMEADPAVWARGAAISASPWRRPWMGSPQWSFPPHVLLLDTMANPLAIVTSSGRLDMPHFGQIKDLKKRRAAQDQFLDRMAKVLSSTGLLHLYFLYYYQYVLDSPIPLHPDLLGCRAHSGDIHQDAYQSLDRKLAGHYLGDCDDLAELYMNITRRQGKLSFVMAVPGHATCGWVEKKGGGYRMQFLDTGPPRIVQSGKLDQVVESGSRSYDERERTMRFDPKSLGFLFRFAHEPTRTPYYLSTRMFVDRDYARIMEKVQSYWHFHFYALGIKTMEEKIAKGDRVSENCTELAGLYGQVHDFKQANRWTREALKQFGPKDILSRMSETFRLGLNLHEAKDDAAAREAVRKAVAELKGLRVLTKPWERTISWRLSMANLLTTIGRPWEAYGLLRMDANIFLRSRRMRLDHAGALTRIYEKMQEQVREEKKTLTAAQQQRLNELDTRVLTPFYRVLLFQPEDDFNDILRKYAFLGMYYGAKLGKKKLLAELTANGPFPEKKRNHRSRAVAPNMEEDWKWIRMAPLSYGLAIGDALDIEKPPKKWRKDEALKLAVAMKNAAQHAKQFGSLGSSEFLLLTTQVTQAFLTKDWDLLEAVLGEVQREHFARLTTSVAEAFGQAARFVTPEEFAAQYRLFAKYVKAKPPYFNVVYKAYRVGAFEHAKRAARLALRHWPKDENMKREAAFLDRLIQDRLKEKAEKGKVKK